MEFHEITKEAVVKAIKEPRALDMALIDSQQARRVMDRIVGYKLSPILWKKIRSGLSAGRVQSVALKLICDRETEIKNFIPEEYWTIKVLHARFVEDIRTLFGNCPPDTRRAHGIGPTLGEVGRRGVRVGSQHG